MKHAEATKVNATLTKRDNSIVLEIADNGIGITQDQLVKAGSFGILGMRERVYPWKGSVSIVSSMNQGARITVSIPAT
jgi:signal transduction histidine kinase